MTDRIQQKEPGKSTVALSDWPLLGAANYAAEYWIDAWQRSILFLDVLRQRGNNSAEHNARKAPNVLSFEVEPVLDGRSCVHPIEMSLSLPFRNVTIGWGRAAGGRGARA